MFKNILAVFAHPDDCELKAWSQLSQQMMEVIGYGK